MKLVINQCPKHGIWNVSIDDDMSGTRLTPSKCCGRCHVIAQWNIDAKMADECITLFEEAKEAAENE